MKLGRRDFLRTGGSLFVYFSLSRAGFVQAQVSLPGSLRRNPQLDSWLRIDVDGSATIFTGKSELGQGIQTALAQIAAEELGLEITRIHMAPVDTNHSPDEGVTAGSMSIEQSGSALRLAAAEARHILTDLAALELGINAARIGVNNGNFTIDNKVTELDYWQLIDGKEFNTRITGSSKPRQAAAYNIVGTPVRRLDIPAKVFGDEVFLHDLRLPGMLHARLLRPPEAGAKLLQADTQSVMQLPGVIDVVRDGSFVAVVAEREEQAVHGVDQLRNDCRWSKGASYPDPNQINAWLQSAPADTSIVAEQGTPGNTSTALTATYTRPYQAHASISPSIAVARKNKDGLTIWSHAQGMYPLRGAIARTLGMEQEQVRCIHVQGAGCYGHNGADDAACDAAIIAMHLPDKAIRLQYSREDEIRWEPYGSAMTMQVKGSLDNEGRIDDWQYDVWSCAHSTRPVGSRAAGNLLSAGLIEKNMNRPAPSRGGVNRNSIPLYTFPNMRITEHFVREMPLRVSALRTLGAYSNIFALESFMDEMAGAAAMDPLVFRIKHLHDERAIAVLQELGKLSGWSNQVKKSASNREVDGRGIGFARYKNSSAYCAVAMHIRVNMDSGKIQLDHAYSVTDAGQVINPDGLRNQIEGGIIQSLSWTLKEKVHFTPAAITTRDWNSYPILSFAEVPLVEVTIINRPDSPALGAGEASQGPAAAALANAVADATGTRLRDIPFTADRLQEPG